MQKAVRTGSSVKGFVSPELDAPGGANLFISDYTDGVVDIYNIAGMLTATLTGFAQPRGLAVDKSGNLYVADTDNFRVLVYAPPYNGRPTTLQDPNQFLANVAVDGNGNVAVTNLATTSAGPGSVSFYAKGTTRPTNIVSSPPTIGEVFFGAFDAKGNLYIDGLDSAGHTTFGIVAGGIKGAAITPLTTSNTFSFPGGVAVTTQGLIAIDDQVGRTIYTYNPPNAKTRSLGSPVFTTTLAGANDPVTFAFTENNRFAVTADAGNGTAALYRFPAGGSLINRLNFSYQPMGVAINPPEIP